MRISSVKAGRSGLKDIIARTALVALLFAKATATLATTAAPVTLSFNPSPTEGVTGYKIAYRVIGTSVTNIMDVGTGTTVILNGLTAGTNYLISALAYMADGQESEQSTSIIYTPPAVSKLALTKTTPSSMQLKFRSAPGSSCRVEYRTNLTVGVWQTLTTGIANSNGDIAVTDSLRGNSPTRFYRAVRL
jgi:hypothetical protein